jgi:hypothetical protein
MSLLEEFKLCGFPSKQTVDKQLAALAKTIEKKKKTGKKTARAHLDITKSVFAVIYLLKDNEYCVRFYWRVKKPKGMFLYQLFLGYYLSPELEKLLGRSEANMHEGWYYAEMFYSIYLIQAIEKLDLKKELEEHAVEECNYSREACKASVFESFVRGNELSDIQLYSTDEIAAACGFAEAETVEKQPETAVIVVSNTDANAKRFKTEAEVYKEGYDACTAVNSILTELESMNRRHESELKELREKHAKERAKAAARHDDEITRLRIRHSRECRPLDEKLNALQSAIKLRLPEPLNQAPNGG